jgi:hypothetical protein
MPEHRLTMVHLRGEAEVEQDPRYGGEGAGEARVPARHGGAQVGAER